MKHLRIFLWIGLAAALPAFGQEKIETDRPGESQSTSLVPECYLQVESGYRKEQQKGADYSVFHPQTDIRYGLSSHFELRAELTSASEKLFSLNENHYGLQPVQLGFKAEITEAKGARPATTFYTQVGIPNWASKDHRKEHVFPKIRLLLENKLTDKIQLLYNAGAEWDGEETAPQWLYTLAPQFELGEKWEVFLETYAYLQSRAAAQHHLDGGFAFYPNKNLKLDLWGGKGLSAEAFDYFVSLGVSFRLKP